MPPNKEMTNKDINVLADNPELFTAFNDLNNNNNNEGPTTSTFVNSTCGCGPLLCMAGILVPFSNEMITGVRGLVRPLIYMAELSKHHLI